MTNIGVLAHQQNTNKGTSIIWHHSYKILMVLCPRYSQYPEQYHGNMKQQLLVLIWQVLSLMANFGVWHHGISHFNSSQSIVLITSMKYFWEKYENYIYFYQFWCAIGQKLEWCQTSKKHFFVPSNLEFVFESWFLKHFNLSLVASILFWCGTKEVQNWLILDSMVHNFIWKFYILPKRLIVTIIILVWNKRGPKLTHFR